MLAGSTADRLGRARVFKVGLVVFTIGSLACSVAPDVHWLIAFRMLQAVGGSMLNPVAHRRGRPHRLVRSGVPGPPAPARGSRRPAARHRRAGSLTYGIIEAP